MNFDPVEFIRTQARVLSPSILPEIKLYLAAEVTPLWQMTEQRLKQNDLPPPFWAFAWPGGQGLARYLLDNPTLVAGLRVVDFASGSGVVGIAAKMAGAKHVLSVDIDLLALEAIKLNAELNDVKIETCDGLDLSKPYRKADVILAGDICYQQATSTSVTRWLRFCVEAGKNVFLCDPGRAYVPREGMTKLESYNVPTSRDLEDNDIRIATVWHMGKVEETGN